MIVSVYWGTVGLSDLGGERYRMHQLLWPLLPQFYFFSFVSFLDLTMRLPLRANGCRHPRRFQRTSAA